VKLTLSSLDGIKKSYVEMEKGILIFDPNKISAEQIAKTINKDTPFQAKVIAVGEVNLADFPKNCGFLGHFQGLHSSRFNDAAERIAEFGIPIMN
jgi:hypothetical protein